MFKRNKFYYDEERLIYVQSSWRSRARNFLTFFLSSFLFAIVLIVLLLNLPFLKTPKELAQERELIQYKTQFDILEKKLAQIEEVLANIEERDNSIYRTYFEVPRISQEQRTQGIGGVNRYDYLEGYENTEIITKAVEKLKNLQKRVVVQSKSLDEITELAKNKTKFLSRLPAIQPVKNENLNRIASGFGFRSDPFTKIRRMHSGIDFSAPTGTPIYATGDGKVIRADSRSTGYGKHIRIDHGFGYVTLYAHLSKYNVNVGQVIKRGEIIGYVGSTGRSQGPHLHYEVIKDQKKINPINFYYGQLTAEEYEKIVELASKENQSFD